MIYAYAARFDVTENLKKTFWFLGRTKQGLNKARLENFKSIFLNFVF